MSSLLSSFRPVLKFSKLKEIIHRNNFHAATIVSNGLNHKGPEYDKMFFHTPQCFPNLKDEEEKYYDKAIEEEGKEKHMFDCEDEPWCTNNERED